MALSAKDKDALTPSQQDEVRRYTAQYDAAKAANDASAMAAAHRAAEQVRAAAGYSGGADGSAARAPARTAGQMEQYVSDYMARNYDPNRGFVNGYSGVVNGRSLANAIRQQMLANTQNWWRAGTRAEKDSLHAENVRLAALLKTAAGGVESSYDEKTGEWTTSNGNLGYGRVTRQDPNQLKQLYGYTDRDIQTYFGGQNAGRYRNFTDYDLVRRGVDESGGYTGKYANAAYGPEGSLLTGGTNLYGDAGTSLRGGGTAGRNGFLSYAENGVIQPGTGLADRRYPAAAVPADGQGRASGHSWSSGASGYSGLSGGARGAADSLAAARGAAERQAENTIDYATDASVKKLLQAQRDAEERYAGQRRQASYDERQALDNSALYAELRGDRGGIGRAQYDSVQNTAAQRRQTIADAQTKLAGDTQQKIADLRARGEYEKADKLLALSQTYLKELAGLQKWAAEYELSQQKLAQSVREWQSGYEYKLAELMGSYGGSQTLEARRFAASVRA